MKNLSIRNSKLSGGNAQLEQKLIDTKNTQEHLKIVMVHKQMLEDWRTNWLKLACKEKLTDLTIEDQTIGFGTNAALCRKTVNSYRICPGFE